MSNVSEASGRRVIGASLIIVALALGLGREWAIRRDLRYAEAIQPRLEQVNDSSLRASVALHAATARAAEMTRWDLLGHGTLGLAGVLAGIAVLVSARGRGRRSAALQHGRG
jgi:hypothetical protein